jgi:hypothetical protein
MHLPPLDSSARKGNVGREPNEWTDIGRTLPCSLYHHTYRSTARPSTRLPQKSAQFAREIYAVCDSVAGAEAGSVHVAAHRAGVGQDGDVAGEHSRGCLAEEL